MKKRWTCLYTVVAMLLILGVLYSLVEGLMFDRGFFEKQYRQYGQAEWIGMSHEDLMKTTDKLLLHMEGKSENMVVYATVDGVEREVFNEQETVHMRDVNALIRGFSTFRYIAFGLAAAALASFFFVCRKARMKQLAKILLYACLCLFGIFAVLGLWAAIDFTSFWTSFHLLLFTNDLWLMDPSTSIMINMFPAQFFSNFIMTFLGRAALAVGLPMLGCGVYLLIKRKA
jgi:integral membrane protein (TIGR01906 family)